jgi:prevent-host-death family protein
METQPTNGGNSVGAIKDAADRMKNNKKMPAYSEMEKEVKRDKAATDPKLSPAERHADWASHWYREGRLTAAFLGYSLCHEIHKPVRSPREALVLRQLLGIIHDCAACNLLRNQEPAREAKNAFWLMIDTARAEPVLIEKHGRGVVMVIAVEEYERLTVRPDARGKTDWPVTGW